MNNEIQKLAVEVKRLRAMCDELAERGHRLKRESDASWNAYHKANDACHELSKKLDAMMRAEVGL